MVLPDKLTLKFHDAVFKSDTGLLTFGVTVTGTGYAPLDTNAIATDLEGKNGQAVRDYFAARSDVESASTFLSPFWARHVPGDTDHITITIVYPSTSPSPTP